MSNANPHPAWVQQVTRFMPRCFACGWDGAPMKLHEAHVVAKEHNERVHGINQETTAP